MMRIGSVLLLLGLVTHAHAESRFDINRLSVDGNVLALTPADLDGDGKLDLIAIYQHGSEVDPPRYMAVFWNDNGSFAAKPDLTMRVDDKACAFDVAEVDDAPGAELLTIGREGVWLTHFTHRKASAPMRIVGDTTVFYRPDPKTLPRLPIVQTIANNKQLLVPLLGAIGVYSHSGNTWALSTRLDIDDKSTLVLDDHISRAHASVPSFSMTLVLPAMHFVDTDGDGLKDIVVTLEDRISVFRQHAGGTFETTPSFKRDFAVRTAAEAQRVVQSATTTVADFDGDGIADLVIGKMSGRGLMAATSTHYLYLGKKGGGYPDSPTQTLKVDGLDGGDAVEPLDLTGDGKIDLVVPSITMGVFNIIRMLTTKTLLVKFQVYPFGTEHRFVDNPVTRELKFKISLTGEADLPALEMSGDYNGDRRPDLAFGISDGEIGIFTGVGADGIVTKDPVERIKVEARGRLHAIDLDHKGKDDIVMHYPQTNGHKNEIVVLKNRGAW